MIINAKFTIEKYSHRNIHSQIFKLHVFSLSSIFKECSKYNGIPV